MQTDLQLNSQVLPLTGQDPDMKPLLLLSLAYSGTVKLGVN